MVVVCGMLRVCSLCLVCCWLFVVGCASFVAGWLLLWRLLTYVLCVGCCLFIVFVFVSGCLRLLRGCAFVCYGLVVVVVCRSVCAVFFVSW